MKMSLVDQHLAPRTGPPAEPGGSSSAPATGSAGDVRPLRLLFVDHTSRMSGAERVLLGVANRFSAQCSVFLFEDGPLRARLGAVGVRTLLPRRDIDLAAIKRDQSLARALPKLLGMSHIVRDLAAAAREHDLVVANSQKAFVLAALGVPFARRPLVWWLHDILAREHFGSAQLGLTVTLANLFAALVIVPSQAAAAAFFKRGGRRPTRVVYNGIEAKTERADPAALRARFGLPTGFLFGVFSRLAPWKGQHVVLQALARLADAQCVIVGGALFGEDVYAERLRQLAADLGVSQRVRFLGHRDDVPALMRSVDAVVHSSVDPEPFGLVLVEAMLQGTPVVAANGGGVPEILDQGRCGVLVPPGDPAALAAALAAIRQDPAEARDRSERARVWASETFSVARFHQRVDAVMRSFTHDAAVRTVTGDANG